MTVRLDRCVPDTADPEVLLNTRVRSVERFLGAMSVDGGTFFHGYFRRLEEWAAPG